MTNDALEERLSDLEAQAGEGGDGPMTVVIRAKYGEIPRRYQVVEEPPDDDPIDEHQKIAIPSVFPPGYRQEVLMLDGEDVISLWDSMPADIREREREYRCQNGEPIPPVLEGG